MKHVQQYWRDAQPFLLVFLKYGLIIMYVKEAENICFTFILFCFILLEKVSLDKIFDPENRTEVDLKVILNTN